MLLTEKDRLYREALMCSVEHRVYAMVLERNGESDKALEHLELCLFWDKQAETIKMEVVKCI